MSSTEDFDASIVKILLRRHLRFGWVALLGFLILGIVLELLHGFKIGWYLETAHATRRLMLTLAHAHGVLLALVNLAFAATLQLLPSTDLRLCRIGSALLLGASILLPSGFLLGGLVIYGGDPGLGILLVQPAAILLVGGVSLIAWAAFRST